MPVDNLMTHRRPLSLSPYLLSTQLPSLNYLKSTRRTELTLHPQDSLFCIPISRLFRLILRTGHKSSQLLSLNTSTSRLFPRRRRLPVSHSTRLLARKPKHQHRTTPSRLNSYNSSPCHREKFSRKFEFKHHYETFNVLWHNLLHFCGHSK